MDKQVRENLERIHREIEATGSIDKKDEELLKALLEDIRGLLENAPRRAEDDDESLRERLNQAIEQMEDNHPTLTAYLSSLSESLGRLAV